MAKTTAATAFANYPRFDATKSGVDITLTQDVCDRALPRTACACLVAEAGKDLPGVNNAWVTPDRTWLLMRVVNARRYVEATLLKGLRGLVSVRFLNGHRLKQSGVINVFDKEGQAPFVGETFTLSPMPPKRRMGADDVHKDASGTRYPNKTDGVRAPITKSTQRRYR